MAFRIPQISVVAAICGLLVGPAFARELVCGETGVSVVHEVVENAEAVCGAVDVAVALFEQCNIPAISRPVRIEIVEDLKRGCVALYHCGEDRIKVLSPTSMQGRRDADGAFAYLGKAEYFHSVIVHELTHAATDKLPCPFESCVAAQEYISYVMQVMSLKPESALAFEENAALDRKVQSDELSPIILFMAPHLFAQKSWTHFSQRDDPCGYVGQLVKGDILIDHAPF